MATVLRASSRRRRVVALPGWRPEFDVLLTIDGVLGLVLWEALRDVRVWADSPRKRSVLFRRPKQERIRRYLQASHECPSLAKPIQTLIRLVERPGAMKEDEVAEACWAVANWAEEHACFSAAALFAEAAAHAYPDSAFYANTAGRLCRRASLPHLSGAYYQRAYTLATIRHEPEETIRALLGYGGLMYLLDRYDRARLFLRRAASRARSTDRRRQAAEAEHDLMLVETEFCRYTAAQMHALAALDHYPVHHPRIPYFVHDIAYFLTVHGAGADALPLLHAVRDVLPEHELVLPWGTLTRAAAAAADRDLYREGASKTLYYAELYPERAAAALRNVALAAQDMQDWTSAREVAALAIVRAVSQGETAVVTSCRAIQSQTAEQKPRRHVAVPAYNKVSLICSEALDLLHRHIHEKRGRPSPRR